MILGLLILLLLAATAWLLRPELTNLIGTRQRPASPDTYTPLSAGDAGLPDLDDFYGITAHIREVHRAEARAVQAARRSHARRQVLAHVDRPGGAETPRAADHRR